MGVSVGVRVGLGVEVKVGVGVRVDVRVGLGIGVSVSVGMLVFVGGGFVALWVNFSVDSQPENNRLSARKQIAIILCFEFTASSCDDHGRTRRNLIPRDKFLCL